MERDDHHHQHGVPASDQSRQREESYSLWADFDHAKLGVSICSNCERPSLNLICEEHGFVLACARSESTLMDPLYPPGWEDQWNPATGDDEETLARPSFDDLQLTSSPP